MGANAVFANVAQQGGVHARVLTCVLMSVSCAGPRLRLEPEGETVQVQCGVKLVAPVTRQQALCIAKLVGLEAGVRQWGINEYEDYIDVFNYVATGSRQKDRGRYVRIHKQTGAIEEVGEWDEVIVHGAR